MPEAAMPELDDWQIELAGVLLGSGTDIPVSEVEGLGVPELRTQDVDNPVEDGAFPGDDLYGPRTIRIEAGIRTPADPAAALDILARLHRAADNPAVRRTPGARAVLRLRWPGRTTRRLYGRLRRVEATSTANALHGWIPLDIEFTALDAHFHADQTSALTLPLDTSLDSQGFRAPLTAPITTGTADPAVRPGWVTNDGDAPAWPTLRITGPVTNPHVQHVETGRTLALGLTLGAGEYADIDTRPGTRWVLRNGTGNAAPALGATSRLDLFTIPPGRSEIRWTATDHTNTSRLAVTWRSAWTAL